MLPKFLLLATLSVAFVDSYNILVVFPIPSRSHNTLGKGIVTALLEDGHQITYVTPYPEKTAHKNLKFVDVSATQKIVEVINMMDDERRNSGIKMVKEMAWNITTLVLKQPEFREVLIKGKFDAVVTEWFFTDIFAGIHAVQQCPWILLNGMVMHPFIEYQVDVLQSPAILPMMPNHSPVPMSFIDRVKNTLIITLAMGSHYFIDNPATEKAYGEIYTPIALARGVPLPPFSAALHNLSMVFINSDAAIAHSQVLPENVFNVGGFHIDEKTPPLPQDLQTLLDNSPQGVIYFSMGSVLKSANFPQHTREALLKIFGKLPHTVLWKFEEKLENMPKNVHIRSWMPQQSILAHPNVKLFITHGGMLSCLEAVHFGVPLLAIPMFGDQPGNADRAASMGYALSVPFHPNLAPEIEKALDEMVKDDRFYNTAKRLSKLFRSRPISPKKLIAFYTRLAIESGGAFHLRSKAGLYPWYQRLLLDQIAVLLLIIYAIIFIVKKLFKALCTKSKEEVKKKKVKKN